jgi:hypothetical protein
MMVILNYIRPYIILNSTKTLQGTLLLIDENGNEFLSYEMPGDLFFYSIKIDEIGNKQGEIITVVYKPKDAEPDQELIKTFYV